jgi:ATP-dependent RNA helicase RhlE
MLFSELGLKAELLRAVSEQGYTEPTPVQERAIPFILDGRDVLAGAQTGTGKTAAFALPILQRLSAATRGGKGYRPVRALILSPTRELAAQVREDVAVYGKYLPLRSTTVYGGVSIRPQIQNLRRGVDILVATPGRLQDHMDQRTVDLGDIEILVLDEADRMLDMGFLPAIRRIAGVLPRQRQTMCFSATLEASVVHLVKDYMTNPVRLAFGSTLKPSENVRVQAFEVAGDRKQAVLQSLLAKETGRCLIFARTKRGTEKLANNLTRQGFAAAMIHGDRSQSQRTAALTGFQQGRYRVLVATDLASRGIHVQDIAHVINYDLPEIAENFIHRVGRTGRAGKVGVASTLFGRDQRSELQQLERTLGIRMERMQADSDFQIKPELDRTDAPHRARMGRLPGEVFHAA